MKSEDRNIRELINDCPALQTLLEVVDSVCSIKITKRSYDGTGNDTLLKNKTFWIVETYDDVSDLRLTCAHRETLEEAVAVTLSEKRVRAPRTITTVWTSKTY